MRQITSVNEFFDTMDGLRNGAFVSIGYITKANIEIPMIKKKNPATNRMKNYPDYETFSKHFNSEELLTGVVKFTKYLINWTHKDRLNQQYKDYKNKVNDLRNKFGIGDMGSKSYTSTINYGDNNITTYQGGNDEKQGNIYYPQNIAKPIRVDTTYYLIKEDGSIYKECKKDELIQFFKNKAKSVSGLSALQKLTQDSATIESYIQQMKELDSTMVYRNFEASSIVYMVGSSKDTSGINNKFIFINEKLRDTIGSTDGFKINPQAFTKMAKENYRKEIDNIDTIINETKKRKITLTESELFNLIAESCKDVLNNININN